MPENASAARGRAVRVRLLAAAAELIAEVGWSAVSTRTLAERAGVAAGLVHYHFAGLPALLREAALTRMRAVLDETGSELLTSPDPAVGLRRLLVALDAYPGRDPTSTLFIESCLAASRDEQLRVGLAELVQDYRHRLVEWLQAAGDDQPARTAAVLAAAVDGVMLHRGVAGGLGSAEVLPVLVRMVNAPRSDQP
jgi:AcrR family transcriptional regulator